MNAQFVTSWAYQVLHGESSSRTVILDTETTDMQGEIIDLAIIDLQGKVLFTSLIKPIGKIEPGAERVHGISMEMVQRLPGWTEQWPDILAVLSQQERIITYNASYDSGRLRDTCLDNGITIRLHLPHETSPRPNIVHIDAAWSCLMQKYADYYGELNPQHGTNKWQRLGRALEQQGIEHKGWHRALGDCQASLKLLRHLAAQHVKE